MTLKYTIQHLALYDIHADERIFNFNKVKLLSLISSSKVLI